MTNLFQDLRVQLTRLVEFSEAAMTAVSDQLIASQKQGLVPKVTALSDGIWQKTYLDALKRARLGKIYVAALSTEHGFGLVVWNAAKLHEIRRGQKPHAITHEDLKGQLVPLADCSLVQKAFVALHSLDLLARLEHCGDVEPA
jgi:hypothetical protein